MKPETTHTPGRWKRLRLFLGLSYRCRCGAIVRTKNREFHDSFHAAFRDWLTPPTSAEIADAKAEGRR